MKRHLTSALFIVFIVQCCRAQQTKEDFLNEVNQKLVDFRFRKLNISPKAEGIWFYSHDYTDVPGLFQTEIPQQALRELYEKAKDSTVEY